MGLSHTINVCRQQRYSGPKEAVITVKSAIDFQLTKRGMSFGTGSKALTSQNFKVVRIFGHRIIWHYGKIVGLNQLVSEDFMKAQKWTTLDTYPPYIGIGIFRQRILSVLRFYATGMAIFGQIDERGSW
jgi:hypothetical protein